MLINASWGLGEALVSGDVTPDQWIVDKERNNIVEEKIAVKLKMTVRNDNGTELVDVPGDKQEQPSLEQNEVLDPKSRYVSEGIKKGICSQGGDQYRRNSIFTRCK